MWGSSTKGRGGVCNKSVGLVDASTGTKTRLCIRGTRVESCFVQDMEFPEDFMKNVHFIFIWNKNLGRQ